LEASIEIGQIDLQYEGHRMRHALTEKRLLKAIIHEGVREPLLGTMRGESCILVDGFKRLRCAKKLGIMHVAVSLIGSGEADAIFILMQRSNAQSLTILEQAKLVGELKTTHGLSAGEIARRLERSVAWVSVRSGLLTEMRPLVVDKIMRGDFPAYVYMYTLRSFMRINKIQPNEIEEFVIATSGQGLSTRDLGVLADGYFRGGTEIRSEIKKGNIGWCLKSLRPCDEANSSSLSVIESKLIQDLDIVARKMNRLIVTTANETLTSSGFFAQAHLICDGVLRLTPSFILKIRGLYDRCRPAPQHCGSSK
jgi:hypothetical protein